MNNDDLDVSRVAVFRQLKKEIRTSEHHLVVGIDVANEKHIAFFGAAQGKILLRRSAFNNAREGFEKLRDQTEAIKVQNGFPRSQPRITIIPWAAN